MKFVKGISAKVVIPISYKTKTVVELLSKTVGRMY